MSFITPHRVDDRAIPNVYEKVPTAGDNSKLVQEAPGREVAMTVLQAVYDTAENTLTFTLPFSFLLGQKQLLVYWEASDLVNNVHTGFQRILNRATLETLPSFNEAVTPHYIESTPNTVVVHNANSLSPAPYVGDINTTGPGINNSFLFTVPHTAKPGSNDDRVIVENQGDNVAIELKGSGDGILLTASNGKQAILRLNDYGTTVVEPQA